MLASLPKVLKTYRPKALKIDVFDYPTVVQRFVSKEPPRISTQNLYRQKLQSLLYNTSLSLMVWVYLHSNFRGGLRKRMYFETECEMAFQGHQSIARIQLPISHQ